MLAERSFLALAATLLAITASASPMEDIFGRAVGDGCTAAQGKGTCQHTANCQEPPHHMWKRSLTFSHRQGHILPTKPLPQRP
jgi:hypothetical protein